MRTALSALLVTLFVLVGCGGDGRLSRGEYIEQANAICDKQDERLQEFRDEVEAADTPEELAAAIDEALPTIRDGFDELRSLEPPEELQGQVDEWNRLSDESLEHIERIRDAAKAGDEQKVQAIATESEETDGRSDELERAIGVDRCARG